MSLFSGLRQKKKKKKTYHTDREAKSSRTVPIFVLEWSPNPLRSSLAHSNWGDTLLMRRVVVGIGGWWSCAQPGVKPPPDSAMSLPHSRFFLSAGFFLTLKESSRCCCKGSDFSLASPGFCTNPVHQIIRKGWSQIPELDFPSATIFFFFSSLFVLYIYPKMFLSPCLPSSGCQGFSSGVQQVLSLSCSFSSCHLWCGFLIQWPKVLSHSCPTTVLSHTGHCPLPLPVIVVSLLRWCSLLPLLFLS